MTLNLHTLLFKTVSFCNLACDYCYVRPLSIGRDRSVISDEIVARAITDYVELTKENRGTGPAGQWMVFLWHGGEPCLAGKDFFGKVVELQKRTQLSDFMINSLTTNCTVLDEEWVRFLHDNQFRVSISLDGPNEVHDLHRITSAHKPTFSKVMDGVDLLRTHSQPFGVLCVVSEESVPNAEKIFQFFVDHGLKRFTFLPRITKHSWLSTEDYAGFMTQVFDLWIKRDDPNICIREFENIIHELLGGRAELCEYNGCCGSYLAIDSCGDVYLCDLFIGDESMRIGNVLKESLKDMLDSPSTLAKVSQKVLTHDDCRDCSLFRICKGGCLYRRRLVRGMSTDKDVYCEARKQIIRYISRKLSEIIHIRIDEDTITHSVAS